MSRSTTTRAAAWVSLVAALAGLAACGPGPSVAQGTVTSYDTTTKVLLVRTEGDQPVTMEVSLVGAEIGADPVVGDTVRLAYRDVGGKLVASRVMNISRQDELGKKGSGGH